MTVNEIKKTLDELGIEYPKSAKKAELVELLESETVNVNDIEETPTQYVVLHDFKDLKDKGYVYFQGDLYPRDSNGNVSKKRIDELSSKNNKRGKVLIKEQE